MLIHRRMIALFALMIVSFPPALMTHDESIALIKSLGAKFTPELKAPEGPMPFDGDYTQ
jgi:hypothetical protein